ncbi:T9SS type A sorting domain-containing protein [Flavobacterium sp. CF136]|uniref:T9SS type A sorting domain-containing protein n=1 Tax=Flavobacterium sp. (strain CF136) TaxID=1144313 RepID=UPI000271A75C|nr:T9SS type A sorting domain-containing protein [Flavobacterium sp. CF136]EJL67102.1 Por secretion system C-terminal sorting domain-containing protein [Flavobacterium sp. CF136]
MKKWNLVLVGLLLLSLTRMSAQDYYMTAPIGYGKAATGGGNATPTLVTNFTELSNALTASGPGVILIQGSIQIDYLSVLATNKTILGLPGSKLYTNDQTSGKSGILYFKPGTKNVIIRNVTFVGPGAYDSDGRDCLTFDGVTDCWVDHCDFQDGMDGNFDNKGNTDNITVSWCKFSYNKTPKAGGSGGTNDHRFSDLIGSSATNYPQNTTSDTQYSITWQYCWWAEGCVERQVRARNAELHMLNCYWNSSVANKCIGLEDGSNGKGTQCYVEGGVFETPSTTKNIDASYGGTPDVTVVDCVGNNLANNSSTVSKPSYSYTALSSSLVKAALTGSCGAGATLNITTAGVISSSCNSGTPVAPTLSLSSGSTSQSVAVNSAISNITYTYGGSATGATVTGLPAGVSYSVSTSAKTVTISGTPTSVQSAAYTVTTSQSSGSAVSLSGTITTVANATLVLISGSTNQSIVLGNPIATIVYTYGGSATGAAVTGLPAGVSYSVDTSAKTVTISGTPTSVQSAAYTVTTSQSSGSAVSLSGTIATVAAASLTLTSGSTNQSIVLGNPIATIVYTYGGSATGATVTGLPAGVSYSVDTSAKTVTISGTPTSVQSAAYTVTTSQSIGNAASLSGTITTVATATLAFTSGSTNQSIALGNPIATIVYTYGGSATGATVTGLPAGVSYSVNTSAKTVTISGTPTSAVTNAAYTVTTSQSSGNAASLSGTITAIASVTLAVPANITASATQTSATINWGAVANATGYTVNLCSSSTTLSNVVMLLNSTSATSAGVYTLNTGDQYKTSSTISTSSACSPAGYTNTYRSGSINDNVLKLVNTTRVSSLVIGAKSSGSTARNLLGYTINGGTQIATGITQSSVATCGEYVITGLNLLAGDQIAFVFDGNVQISYFIAKVSSSGTTTCTETNVTGTSYTATGLSANTSISYQVKATSTSSAYVNSAYSTAVNITTNNSTTARYAAMETENISKPEFQCYPTLVENEIQISLPETGNATITIFDLTGHKLMTVATKERNTTLDLSSLKHGVYIVSVFQNKNFVQRIIKK